MKLIKSIILAVLAAAGLYVRADGLVLNGAGASFPAPVYQRWTNAYSDANGDVKVNYQSLGSGAGMNQIRANTIDFAGTDNPLTAEEQERDGLVQFPMLTGGVVVIYNLPGVKDGELKLSPEALSEIYLGKIKNWDDPVLASLNPGVKLPKTKITVVRRADASGTSFIFTDYLSKVSPEWKEKVGAGSAVKWPVGLGGQKNSGVCNNVAKIAGAIGYTEFTYAVEAKLTMAKLQNQAGVFVDPTPDAFSASAAYADWASSDGFYMVLTNQPGEASWPITGVSYILVRKDCPAEKRAALNAYFRWCFEEGGEMALKLNYVPIPFNVVDLFKDLIK